MKKITKATIKSFIKNNEIYIIEESKFNGMTDCVENTESSSIRLAERVTEGSTQYNLGIKGAWFVGSSRDYFEAYEVDGYKGYRVYNCCGSFVLLAKASLQEQA